MVGYIQGTFRDGSGRIVPNGSVTVIIHGTSTVATMYSDIGCTIPYTNVTTGTDGSFLFYVNDSGILTYDLTLSATGYNTKTYVDVYPLGRYTGSVYSGALTNINGIVKGNGSVLSTAGYSDLMSLVPSVSVKQNAQMPYAFTAADKGGTFCFNCTTAKTATFPAAATAGNGWYVDLFSIGAGVITLDLGALVYWWNESTKIGRYIKLGQKTRVWTDGTYWYISPVFVEFSTRSTALLNGTSTTWAAIDLSSIIPLAAKFVYGWASAAVQAKSLYLASAATIGTNDAVGIDIGGGTSSVSTQFILPVVVPQTIYYAIDASGTSNAVYISGYGI